MTTFKVSHVPRTSPRSAMGSPIAYLRAGIVSAPNRRGAQRVRVELQIELDALRQLELGMKTNGARLTTHVRLPRIAAALAAATAQRKIMGMAC